MNSATCNRRVTEQENATNRSRISDGQLAGTPSVMFDAVAIILSDEGCAALMQDGAAIDFAMDAFGHLKAIGLSPEAQPLLDKARVVDDSGVVKLTGKGDAFLEPARTRQWAREPKVRTLAWCKNDPGCVVSISNSHCSTNGRHFDRAACRSVTGFRVGIFCPRANFERGALSRAR